MPLSTPSKFNLRFFTVLHFHDEPPESPSHRSVEGHRLCVLIALGCVSPPVETPLNNFPQILTRFHLLP